MALDLASALSLTGLLFDSSTRLFRLEGSAEVEPLMVESWSLREELDQPWTLELSALSLDAGLDTGALLAEKVTLQCVLADGSLSPRTGIVFAAGAEESDGGFARYRLTLRPWIALLAHSRRSQVWQEQTTIQIVESVFARYSAHAQWRWADDVSGHLAQSPWAGSSECRSYTVQYRETDLAFVSRLLAEEGLGWRVEEDEQAPSGHGLVIFADSPADSSCPEDATSEADGGIRFHRSSSVETSDSVQAFGGLRTLQSAATATLAWDYAAKRAVAATVPTNHAFGGANAPSLEHYRPARAYAFATAEQAQRAATLQQEAIEVRNKTWLGRSTVRTLQPGRTFTLTDSPLDLLGTAGAGAATTTTPAARCWSQERQQQRQGGPHPHPPRRPAQRRRLDSIKLTTQIQQSTVPLVRTAPVKPCRFRSCNVAVVISWLFTRRGRSHHRPPPFPSDPGRRR